MASLTLRGRLWLPEPTASIREGNTLCYCFQAGEPGRRTPPKRP